MYPIGMKIKLLKNKYSLKKEASGYIKEMYPKDTDGTSTYVAYSVNLSNIDPILKDMYFKDSEITTINKIQDLLYV